MLQQCSLKRRPQRRTRFLPAKHRGRIKTEAARQGLAARPAAHIGAQLPALCRSEEFYAPDPNSARQWPRIDNTLPSQNSVLTATGTVRPTIAVLASDPMQTKPCWISLSGSLSAPIGNDALWAGADEQACCCGPGKQCRSRQPCLVAGRQVVTGERERSGISPAPTPARSRMPQRQAETRPLPQSRHQAVSASCNSPASNISIMMSAPPRNSPFTYNCGMVGQLAYSLMP